MNNYFSENKDLYETVFTALKSLGVKVPKTKNFKSCVPKQEKNLLSTNKMFGIGLLKQEWTYENDYPLPVFLAVSTGYLLKFSTTVGLFRKSGSLTRQRNLRIKLESGESLEGSDPNDVASLLKQWLRELPEPLIPQYMHDLFGRCQHLDKEDCASASLLSCLLLPPEHLHPLKHLLCFLKKCAECCNENKMGAHNLALMMAPNIFISKAESNTKTCNSLIQLHTSVIQLLIENSEQVGEVPLTVAVQFSSVSKRRGSEPPDILKFSPPKLDKKRRSGTVHDLFSGFKKLVGQNTNVLSSIKILTPEKYHSSPKMPCESSADSDQFLSTFKKNAFMNEKAFSPLITKNVQALPDNKLSAEIERIRRKSFGFLQRKDRKRQKSKSPLPNCSLTIFNSSNFNTGIKDGMDSSFQGPTDPDKSEEKSPTLEFEQDVLMHENESKCKSVCNWDPKEFILSTPTSSHPDNCNKLQHFDHLIYSNYDSAFSDLSENHMCSSNNNKILSIDNTLLDPQTSKINLSNLDSCKRTLKTKTSNYHRHSDSSTKYSLSEKNSKKDIDAICKTKRIDRNSINRDACNLKTNFTSDLSKSLIKQTGDNLVCKTNLRKEAHSVKSKSKNKSTAHQMKSIDNICRNKNEKSVKINRSKSFMDTKWKNDRVNKNDLSSKVPNKTTRHSSLFRGKPNNIKSGLMYHHLCKTPNHTENLELNNSEKLSYQIQNNATFITRPYKDVSRIDNEKFFSEQDISMILNSGNFNKSSNNKVPKVNYEYNSEISTPAKDIFQKGTLYDGIPLYSNHASSHSDSKIPKLRHSLKSNLKEASEIITERKHKSLKVRLSSTDSRIPVLSKEKCNFFDLESTMNDSCFLTPNHTIFNSPDPITWTSGSKYLGFDSPLEGFFNKRESISQLLKYNPGHVQAKVELFNSRVVKSCSTPSIAMNGKLSVCDEPRRCSSQKQLPNSRKGRKTLSATQSCDLGSRKITGKSRIKDIPTLELPIDKKPLPSKNLPLKEVTNINSFGAKQGSRNRTSIKESSALQKHAATSLQNKHVDLNKKKLKRNSFAGQTPSEFSKKVSRSKSSPSCPKPGTRPFKTSKNHYSLA